MYERLSARLDRVIKLAHEIARHNGQDYLGTEHLLLAIVREGTGGAVQWLAAHGVKDKNLTQSVEKHVKERLSDTWVMGRLPGSPHFRNTIALAIEEARRYDSKEVETEHLLLALLQEKGSVAYAALKELKIRLSEARKWIGTAAK